MAVAAKSNRWTLKTSVVEARQAKAGEKIPTVRGLVVTNDGDWVLSLPSAATTTRVPQPDGSTKLEEGKVVRCEVLDNDTFRAQYEPADS